MTSTSSIPHRKAAEGSGRGCNELQSSIDLRPLDYKSGTRMPYPSNALPSCNEIYDCDLVSSNPARRYGGPDEDGLANRVRMTPDEARTTVYLFRLRDGTPLTTPEEVQEMFCFDKKLDVHEVVFKCKVLRYVVIDGLDKNTIENHIPWVRELDDYEAEFIRV